MRQLSDSDEIIISDDGSDDDTLETNSAFHDARIRIFKNKGRHGVVPNFENALSKAKGDIIFCYYQDDIWADNKVQIMVRELQNADFVVHDALIMDKDDNVSDVNYYSLRKPHLRYWNNLIPQFGNNIC